MCLSGPSEHQETSRKHKSSWERCSRKPLGKKKKKKENKRRQLGFFLKRPRVEGEGGVSPSCSVCSHAPMCVLGEFPGARRGEENPAEPHAGTEASPQPRGTEGSIGFGRVEAERAALGERREAGTCYRTSGMSWKSALESSVPMERAMKNVRTRRKNAFWVHGTMKSPSREATLIIDTLRKPKPQTAEREETRARHYRGSRRGVGGEGPEPPPRAGRVGRARAGLRAPEQLSLLLRMLPL